MENRQLHTTMHVRSVWLHTIFALSVLFASTHSQRPSRENRTPNTTAPAGGVTTSSVFSTAALAIQPMSTGTGYLINTEMFCEMKIEPSSGGAVLGGLFDGHGSFKDKEQVCHEHLGWSAVELSAAFAYGTWRIEELLTWSRIDKGQPGRLLGTQLRDSCSSGLLGVSHAQHLSLTSSAFVSVVKAQAAKVFHRENLTLPEDIFSSCTPRMVIMIGPTSSKEVAVVSPQLSLLKIPHISFWATSTQFNNVAEYPYLFRTSPSDNYQAAALADIVEHFGWSYVSVIAAGDEIYSGRLLELFEHEADRRGSFCIAYEERFTVRGEGRVVEITQKVLQEREANVVVIIAPATPAVELLKIFSQYNISGRVFIGSEDWVTRIEGHPPDVLNQNALLGLTPNAFFKAESAVSWLDDLWQEMRTYPRNTAKLNEMVGVNPWFRPYFEQSVGCRLPLELGRPCRFGRPRVYSRGLPLCNMSNLMWSPPPPLRARALLFAMEVAARAMLSAYSQDGYFDPLNRNCSYPPGEQMLQHVKKVMVNCADDPSGFCGVFDPNTQSGRPIYTVRNWNSDKGALETVGDWNGENLEASTRLTWRKNAIVHFGRQYGHYDPANSKNRMSVPESRCSQTCLTGEKREFHKLNAVRCCWKCVSCPKRSVSFTNNSNTCSECSRAELPNSLRSECVPISVDTISFSSSLGAVVTSLAVIGAALGIFTLTFFWRFSSCYLVRASDLNLSTAILSGVILGNVLSLLLLSEPSDVVCRLPPVFSTPWTVLTAAGILVKTNRFHVIFTGTTHPLKRSRRMRFLLSTSFQLCVITVLTFVSIALGVIHVLIEGPKPERVYPDGDMVYLVCSHSSVWIAINLAYLLLLLSVCAFLAFQTRRLPDNYNDGRLVAMAAFTTCIVWLGFSPAIFLTESSLRPAILAIAIVAQMWAIWACLYAPRLIPMLRSQEVRSLAKDRRQSNFLGPQGNLSTTVTTAYAPRSGNVSALNVLDQSRSNSPAVGYFSRSGTPSSLVIEPITSSPNQKRRENRAEN